MSDVGGKYNKMTYQKYSFENLDVYNLSLGLVVDIYKIVKQWPKEEMFALSSQIRRAVTSVVLNISEGSGRGSKKEFSRFISNSIGSLFEVKACLYVALKLGYLSQSDLNKFILKIDELFFKLSALKRSLVR